MLWQSRPGRWGPAEALAAAQARRAGCTTTSTTTCTCSCAAASAYACSRLPVPAVRGRPHVHARAAAPGAPQRPHRVPRAGAPPGRRAGRGCSRAFPLCMGVAGRGGTHLGPVRGLKRPFALRKWRCERLRVQRLTLTPLRACEGRRACGWGERGGRGRVAAPARGGRLRGRRRGAGRGAGRRTRHARGGRQRVRARSARLPGVLCATYAACHPW